MVSHQLLVVIPIAKFRTRSVEMFSPTPRGKKKSRFLWVPQSHNTCNEMNFKYSNIKQVDILSYWMSLAVIHGSLLLQETEALLLGHMPFHNLQCRHLLCSTNDKTIGRNVKCLRQTKQLKEAESPQLHLKVYCLDS